jgi:hypothetical protein
MGYFSRGFWLLRTLRAIGYAGFAKSDLEGRVRVARLRLSRRAGSTEQAYSFGGTILLAEA